MRLLYFKQTDTLEQLKKERNRLAKKYHPDKNKSPDAIKTMQAINTEYEYVLSGKAIPTQIINVEDFEAIKQASKNIHHATVIEKNINYQLLYNTFQVLRYDQLKPLTEFYLKKYGIDLITDLEKKITNKRTKAILLTGLKYANGKGSFIDIFKFFKHL